MSAKRAWIPLIATIVLFPAARVPVGAQETGAPFVTVNAAPEGAELEEGEHFTATEMSDARPLSAGAVGPSPVFLSDDEYGCAWATAVATAVASGVEDWIGVARRGTSSPDTPESTDRCPAFQTKLTMATAAGASGIIIVNFEPSPSGMTAVGRIPGVMIGSTDGERLIASLDASAPESVQVTLELLDPTTLLPPEPVLPTRIISADASASGDTVSVSGRALFGGEAPVLVGTDPEGDPANRLPAETGNDLVAAWVAQTDVFSQDLELVWELAELPPSGGVPEFMRYFWDFGVDTGTGTTLFQIDGRFTNVIGSAAGQDPSPDSPNFDLEGNCTQDGNIISCEKIADLDASMDADTGRITALIPKSILEEQVGGSVDGATIQEADIFEGIAVLPSVVGSLSGTGDTMLADRFDYYEIAFPVVEVGIVPAGAPAEYTTSVDPAANGTFSATLDTTGLGAGSYDVHVRACFGTNCDTAVAQVTL